MKTTAQDGKVYWRTRYGSHRHQSWYCANRLRAIRSGNVLEVPQAKVNDLPPCAKCTAQELADWTAGQTASKRCANNGVTNPRWIKSECTDCGKTGTVQRSTGRLRAHDRARP